MNNLKGFLFAILAGFFLVACAGGGDGGDQSGTSTRISGTVSLSSTVAGSNKPADIRLREFSQAPKMKANGGGLPTIANKPIIGGESQIGNLMAIGDVLADAYVYLYDAEHPEWLAPVAQDITDDTGAYAFENYGCTAAVGAGDCSATAASNGNAYTDGDPLPQGIYTMLIYKPSTFDPIAGVTTDPIVAVMPAFKAAGAEVQVEEAEAEVSDATPRVVTMVGTEKNTDGTYTWGSTTVQIPNNAKVQVSFDMAMSRGSVQNIVVEDTTGTVSGSWSLSPDWRTATFNPAASLATGTHTITVPETITNVYGNAIGYEAVGSFSAVASDSTAPTVTLSSPGSTSSVAAGTPIRISSNELLDVNGLELETTPSVGDLPGVLFLGQSGSNFIYEFDLTDPPQIGQTYSYTISGIQDLAGNDASNLTGSFSMSATADGVTENASAETKASQIAVVGIFNQWVSAANERNLSQIQALMSGSFVFEYNPQAMGDDGEGGFMEEDINRNGRLSLNEFMNMMEKGMTHWEYCETTLDGAVVGDVAINSATSGNFEFTLQFNSTNKSQQCNEGGPEDSMYATVRYKNGEWKLARMSEGFDHRGQELTSYELIETKLYDASATLVPSGGTMSAPPSMTDPITIRFEPIASANSYILMLANVRNPSRLGFAMVIDASALEAVAGSTTQKSFTVPDVDGTNGLPFGSVEISELFGFDNERDWRIEGPGETFVWEIIGLASLASTDFDPMAADPVTVVDMIRDIEAVSAVKKFKNPGEKKDLSIVVASGATELTFDEYIWGFDAVDAGQLTITVTTPNDTTSGGFLYVNSPSGWEEYPLSFADQGTTANASVTVNLFQGWNWIDLSDGVDLYTGFQVKTTGGIAPSVERSAVNASSSTTTLGAVTFDDWDYGTAPSGTVTIDATWALANNADITFLTGAALCSGATDYSQLYAWVWNDSGAYAQYSYCESMTGWSVSSSEVTLVDIPIFEGNNWISLEFWGQNSSAYVQASSHFGVYTDTGTEFVPPVSVSSVATSEGVATNTGDWGQGSDWNATNVTTTTSTLVITGSFANPVTPAYYAGADGVWTDSYENPSALVVDGSNNFTLTVTLYNGWNWISIDDGDGGWYNVNVYTDNGETLPKPVITTVNGTAPTNNDGQVIAEISTCTATVAGTAPGNTTSLYVNWNGSTGPEDYYYEYQQVTLTGGGSSDSNSQTWSVTVDVVGGSNSYNWVDVYDEQNGTWTGVEVRTSDSSCSYQPPA